MLESHGFEEYKCDRERVLGINISKMLAIMRMTHANSEVILQADDSQIRIQAINPSTNHTFDFYFPLLKIDHTELQLP